MDVHYLPSDFHIGEDVSVRLLHDGIESIEQLGERETLVKEIGSRR